MKLQNIKHKGKFFKAFKKRLLVKETPIGNFSKSTMEEQENRMIFLRYSEKITVNSEHCMQHEYFLMMRVNRKIFREKKKKNKIKKEKKINKKKKNKSQEFY